MSRACEGLGEKGIRWESGAMQSLCMGAFPVVVTEGCVMILLYGRPLGDREGGKSDERSQETCLLRGISDLLPTDLLSCKSDLIGDHDGETGRSNAAFYIAMKKALCILEIFII